MNVSRILQALEPSATLAMAAKAKQLALSGKKVYDFSVGEPDFPTPPHIRDAAVAAMQAGRTKYTAAPGIIELRQAVAKAYRERYGLQYSPDQVVVSNGAKHSLHNALTAICNPGDEVLVPAPYWVSYVELVKLTGAKPVIVATRPEDQFKLSPEQLRGAVTPKTTLLILCSPSNPTGSVYSAAELKALADVVLEKNLSVISDEIYDRLLYTDFPFTSFPTVRDGLQPRTIVVNGVSKTYSMTGWRIGWTLAPENVSRAMADLQSQETSNPSSISQYAALAALEGPQRCVEEMRKQFAERRQFVSRRLAELDIGCTEMAGAFYAFIDIRKLLGASYGGARVENSAQWCLALLDQQGVATVMGSAFGAEGYARLSFATSLENLKAGFDRIETFIRGRT